MFEKAKSGRDAFTFSLRGIKLISSYHAIPAIAHDRINKAWDERLSQRQENQPDTTAEIAAIKGRYWLFRRLRRAA